MSKKIMRIPSMLKKNKLVVVVDHQLQPKQQWQWMPSCKHPKTLSFRSPNDDVFRTLNSVFLDPSDDGVQTPDSWFSSSSDCTSNFSEQYYSEENNSSNTNAASDLSVETIIRSAVKSSDRLFFDPDRTSSILKEEEVAATTTSDSDDLPFKESVALALESDDPYSDFKKSMQEMVESHGLNDWECLEELLGWYLRMNKKMNHGIIVGAFVDLLVGLSADSIDTNNNQNHNKNQNSCSDSTSYSSADSCFSSSPCSPAAAAGVILGSEE